MARSLTLLSGYLRAHRGGARFLVAATDAKTADPIALASGLPVITVGGFSGVDPAPTTSQLESLIGSGQLRYVLVDASRVLPATVAQRSLSAAMWAERHCARVPSSAIGAAGAGGASRADSAIASTLSLFACG